MANDVEIRVRVDNDTARGLASVNASIRTLGAHAAAADRHLAGLSSRTRTLRDDTDALDASMRRLGGSLAGARGGLGGLSGAAGRGGDGMNKLKAAAISLAPALVPIGASLVPIAAGATAAGVAVGAFGLAVAGQVPALSRASEAQKKYKDAVREHGKTSAEAAKAQTEYLRALNAMPAPTRQAALALGVLKDDYKEWSNLLAGSAMPVATKAFANFGALLPRLSPVVRGASRELDRLMTVMGGGIQSAGFERFMNSFAAFSSGALRKATDGLISFSRAMDSGTGRGQMAEFMDYARTNGPLVGETLRNLARALTHLVAAAADTGVSMLTVVNAFAKMVNAIPTDVLSTLLQLAVAYKAVTLAAAGLGAASTAMAAFTGRATAMRAASTAAGGGLAGLSAAFGTLSRGAKIGLAAAAIGGLLVVLNKLKNDKPAIEVDALGTALNTLATRGKVTGELKSNLEEMSQSIAMVSKGASDNRFAKLTSDFGTFVGLAKGPGISDAAKNVDAWDKSMANLVRGGDAKTAAAQFEILKKAWRAGGGDMGQLKQHTNDYRNALADMKFEAKLAAESQGLFGRQAQSTQRALAAQKASADGLRQSLVALNETQRAGLGGMIGFEQAIDDAAKAARENAGALSMSGGRLNLNSQKARDAASALQDLATKTDEAATASRASTGAWAGANRVYARGRSELIRLAVQMGLSRAEARQLASQILKIPDKKTRIRMDKEDAVKGLREVKAAIQKTPGAKSVKVSTLNKQAIAALEAVGLKTKRLPNGKTVVTTKNGQAIGSIGEVQRALANIPRTINTTVTTTYQIRGHKSIPSGTYYGSTAGRSADGNIYGRAYADGGMEQHVAQIAQPTYRLWAEPETGGEAYIPMSPAKRPRSLAILDEVADRFGFRLEEQANGGIQSFASGGLTDRQRRARERRKEELRRIREARGELSGAFGISRFGQRAGYSRDAFEKQLAGAGSVGDLVSNLNKWRNAIRRAAEGGAERRLLRGMDRTGAALIKQERNLNRVNDQLSKAKDKLSDLRQSASQLRDSVKSGIVSSANVTGVMEQTNGRIPTAGLILSQLQTDRDKSGKLAGALATLKKRGLDKRLISEIAEAGIEGGGLETAQGLLGADKAQIKRMNSLRSQIASNAGKVGDVARDAMYGAGIKAAEGLVRGLQKKQNAIEKQMLKIARAMEKSIKRALGIRSPSKVTEGIGDMTAEGFALGVERNRRVPRAWQSLLAAPAAPGAVSAMPAARRGGDGAALSPVPVILQLDGREVARGVFDPMQGEIRRHGGDPNVLTRKVVFR
ncbi:hypothetical protein GCM10010400_40050 [Streptomyces aculeolatus]|uniref:hypothetical protein n=1 Tax=Streptomyces aculeolatus TaxID=270689 RepID=UPI001CEC6344|nr:hypothetical protein [Streptomyces aculeolatus]